MHLRLAGALLLLVFVDQYKLVPAGMKFFPGYVTDSRRQNLDIAALRWNQVGQSQKRNMKWGDRSQLQGGLLMLEAPTSPAVAQRGKQTKKHVPAITGPDSSFAVPGATSTAQVNGMPIPQSGEVMFCVHMACGLYC